MLSFAFKAFKYFIINVIIQNSFTVKFCMCNTNEELTIATSLCFTTCFSNKLILHNENVMNTIFITMNCFC